MLADALVFSIDGEGFRWRDVFVAAWKRGEWSEAERHSRQGNAAVRAAQAGGVSLAPGALEVAGQEFRYARELVTAHSMEQWLARSGMSSRDWTGHLRRELHCGPQTPRTALRALTDQHPLDEDEAARITLIDVVCSGVADQWARVLAGRVAANRTTTRISIDAARETAVPRGLARALQLDDDTWRSVSRRIDEIDATFEGFRAAQLTRQAVESYVAARQLEWTRFDCRLMTFPSADMAAEAALLLREDDEGFTGVYHAAHTEPQRSTIYFDRLDPSVRDHFLGAHAGDLVGPLRTGDTFVLYLVVTKALPSTNDPEIRRLAEDGVLSHALKQQLDHVEWHAVLH
jgi:hypothetical protein